MSPRLIDFHCHLDLFPDMEKAVRDADAAGVYTLTVTTTPRAWPRNNELTRPTSHVRAALGLHPQLVLVDGDVGQEAFQDRFIRPLYGEGKHRDWVIPASSNAHGQEQTGDRLPREHGRDAPRRRVSCPSARTSARD